MLINAHKRFLVTTAVLDGGLDVGADRAGAGTESLDLADNLHGSIISDLAEDDVLAIEPRGDDGGDEELRAVAEEEKIRFALGVDRCDDLRVGAGVGHGQETGLGVLQREVLIGELLAVDGATTGTLF
jgi:hypothetical protein